MECFRLFIRKEEPTAQDFEDAIKRLTDYGIRERDAKLVVNRGEVFASTALVVEELNRLVEQKGFVIKESPPCITIA
jgi:hypothetical protein